MGVRLDWEIESDSGRDSVDVDSGAKAKRRRCLIIRLLLGTALILALLISLMLWRIKIVRNEQQKNLEATVESEALALRLGDLHKFMTFQGSSEEWHNQQRANFESIQLFQPRVTITGKIIALRMTTDEASVTIEYVVSGESGQAIWLYKYTDKGWKHIASEQEPWAQQTREIGPFTFTYFSIDQSVVKQLEVLLSDWWQQATSQTGVSEPLELEIKIGRVATSIEWEDKKQTTLIIPSSSFNGTWLDPNFRNQLGVVLAERWALHAIGFTPDNSNHSMVWIVDQLALWIQPAFGIILDRQSAFDPLSRIFGPTVMPDFLAQMREKPDFVLAMQHAMRINTPSEFKDDYFANYIEIVISFAYANPEWVRRTSELTEILFDLQADSSSQSLSIPLWLLMAQPGTIHIESKESYEDILWIRVSFQINQGNLLDTGQTEARLATTLIPFRMSDGYWRLTAPSSSDWGSEVIEQGQYVTLSYGDLDAPYFRDRLSQIEQIYLWAAEDFGLVTPPPLMIMVEPIGTDLENDPTEIVLALTSPHQSCCVSGTTLEASVADDITYRIYASVLNYQAGDLPNSRTFIFENALQQWARQRRGLTVSWDNSTLVSIPDVPIPASLGELWDNTNVPNDENSPYQYQIISIGVYVLVEVLMERYGEESLVPLVQHLRSAPSIDEWLRTSLDTSVQNIEAEWLKRFHQVIQQSSGS